MNQRMSKRQKKSALRIFALALAVLVAAASVQVQTKAEEDKKEVSVEVTAPKGKVLTYEYRKSKDFVLDIKNTGKDVITNFVIAPGLQKRQGL